MTLSSVVFWRLEGWSEEVRSSGRVRTMGERMMAVISELFDQDTSGGVSKEVDDSVEGQYFFQDAS